METYTLSPAERRARAQALREQRENRYQYKKYFEEKAAIEQQQRQAELDIKNAESQRKSADFFTRTISTLGDVAGNIITGALKGIEGIYDLGAGIVGAVGGMFSDEFSEGVKSHIAYDAVGQWVGNPIAEMTKYFYIYDTSDTFQNITRGVASGVGQILPAVAVSILTAGAGAPSAVASIASSATFIAGAAGRGTEEAFNEGADFYQGLGYGVLTGAVEGAIEKLSGGVSKAFMGKGLIDDVIKGATKKITTNAVAQKGLQVLIEAGGEGAEEWVSELVNPYLKRMTYNSEAELSTSKSRLEAALIGGLTSLAYSGSIGRVGAKSRNVSESLAEINTLKAKEENLWGNGKLDIKNSTDIKKSIDDNYQEISKSLVKANEKSRVNIIKKFKLESTFNADGTLINGDAEAIVADSTKPNLATAEEQNNENGQILETQTTTEIEPLASPLAYNREAYSPSLIGKEVNLAFKPTIESLTDAQIKARQDFTKLNKGKVKAKLVFTNDLSVDSDGNIQDGAYKNGILYINTKANAAEVVVKHELSHFAEGTKAYLKYADFVLREINSNDIMTKKFGNLIEKINETSELYKAVNQGKDISQEQREVLTEVIAQYTSENLFTNEEQINRLARVNRNFFQKVIDWFKDTIGNFQHKKNLSKEEKETVDFLKRAEKLYSKALQEAWGASDHINYSLDRDKFDANKIKRYNKGSYNQYDTLAKQWAFSSKTKAGDKKVLFNARTSEYNLIIATKDDNGFAVLLSIKDTEKNVDVIENLYEEERSYGNRKNESIYEAIDEVRNPGRHGQNDLHDAAESNPNRQDDGFYRRESQRDGNKSESNGNADIGKSNGTPNSGVKFSSNSITTNEKDIKYSLVKDNKDLVAIHNLSEEKLLGILELGGFPMPSIAVTKPTILHDNFGDISVVFDKSAVDPKRVGNAVFPGDAYSPRFPSIGYKISERARLTAYEKVTALLEGVKLPKHMTSANTIFYEDNIQSDIDRRGSFADARIDDKALQIAFLKDKKIGIEIPLKEEKIDDLDRRSIVDTKALYEILDKKVDKKAFKKWLIELSSDFIEKKGIRNNAEAFTASGNRRSFESLHYEYTLQNIIKIMKSEGLNGAEKMFGTSPSGIAASLMERFKSIDAMKKHLDMLNALPEEEIKKIKDKQFDMLSSITADLVGKDASFDAIDGAAETIGEIASKKLFTSERILAYLDREYKDIYHYDESIAGKILDLFETLKENPTEYFEAKPLRTVGFDEVKAIIVPNDISPKLKTVLTENNLPIYEYSKGESRTEIIGKLDNIRFSLKKQIEKDSEGKLLTEKQIDFFKDTKVLDDEGNLKEVYHGTMGGGFNVFDASRANVESDMGAGFYFTSNYDDVSNNYEKGGQDFENKISRLAEQIETDEDIDYEEAKKKATKKLKKGSKLFEVYLDIKNPAYVGGNYDSDTYLFENFVEDVDRDEYETDEDYEDAIYAAQDEAIQDIADKVDRILLSEEVSGYEDWVSICSENGVFEGGVTIKNLKDLLENNLYDVSNAKGDIATSEVVRAIVEALGYDGIIDNSVVDKWGYNSGRNSFMEGIDEETRHYIVFKPNQIKLASNQNPTKSEDIRYSLSNGEVKKVIANKTKLKSYTKDDAEVIINGVMSHYMAFGDKYGDLSGKTKRQAITLLWEGLNTADKGYQAGIALDIANYIIENSVMEDVYADNDNTVYIDVIRLLKPYLHKIDLSSLKGEIAHKFDKDKSVYALWGKRKGEKGYGADQVGQELLDFGMQIEATNEVDIFFEIDSAYRKAINSLKKQAKIALKDVASAEELRKLKQDIAREILIGYDKQGTETAFGKTIKKYIKQIQLLKGQVKDLKERNKALNNLYESIDKLKGLEKYQKADIELADEVLGLIKLLKKVKTYRGNLSQNVRDIMIAYSKEVDGKKLYDIIANAGNGIDNPVAQLIEDIAHKNGDLSTQELRSLDLIMQNAIHNINNYDKVFFEGKTQEDTQIVEKAIKETKESKKVKDSGVGGSFSKFSRWLTAPIWRFQRLCSYRKNGIMSKLFTEFQNGVSKQAQFNMEVAEHYKEFFTKNKKVAGSWTKATFEIGNAKLSRGQAISLYMLSLREQAKGHLFNSKDGSFGTIRITDDAIANKGRFSEALTKGQDVIISQDVIDSIEKSLTVEERKFISLTQEFFNRIAKKAKVDTDMALFGISNAVEDNYIPIRVADDQLYKQIGDEQSAMSFKSLFSVYTPSFNKDVKPNSKNKIVVENIMDIVNRHAKQMSAYYGLAVPVKTFNRLYNKTLDNGEKLSVEIAKMDSEFEKYVGKLLSDMQGNVKERTGFDHALGKIRGWGAKAALGLNLKVLANQFVSLPAAAAIGVKYRSLAKGFTKAVSRKTDFDILVKYCPMLYDRFREGNNIDVGLLKENQGVLGKVDALTNLTTLPISKIDKFICGAVWNSCLEQTKNNANYTNYSDEHYKATAKLTEEAVIKTQANYLALYRPAILREQNSLLQLSTMFMSEPLQQFSLLASALDKIKVAKALLKNSTVSDDIAEAQELLKTSKTEARHAITAVAIDSVLLVLIAQAFKWVKGKEDDDKVEGIIGDFTENFVGMFPFIRDIYSLFQGYDVTNMAYSGLTNITNGVKEMYSIIDLLISGKAYSNSEIAGGLRKTLLGISQTFGIPLRNLETYIKGIIEKFSPSATYKYDSFFYNRTSSNYAKDLQKAIDNGDEKLSDTILDLMLNEEKVGVKDNNTRKIIKDLYEQGFNVLPKSISNTITYDSEEITLTKNQFKQFKTIYEEASDEVKTMTQTDKFLEALPEVQARSIKFIYDYHYNLALEDLLGIDLESKNMLFAKAFNISDLAVVVSSIKDFETTIDKHGNIVQGSKKAKVQTYINSLKLNAAQKYMLMGYCGYSNSKGDIRVKQYIQSLKLSKKQKETLFTMSGYEKSKVA